MGWNSTLKPAPEIHDWAFAQLEFNMTSVVIQFQLCG